MSSTTTTTRPRRAVRVALTGALALAPLLAVSAALVPATAAGPSDTELAAGYLQSRLAAGGHVLNQEFGGVLYPDYGVTADAVLALDAAGTGQTEAAATTTYLEDNVLSYTGFGDPAEIYAGPVAKLLNLAVAQQVDPTDFGGTDLVTTLEGLEDVEGRFSDQSQYGDNSNVFGQSLAVGGLARAGSGPSAESVQLLRDQQCDDGGFPVFFADDCVSDPDASALAVQALIRVAGAEDGHVLEGLDYLAVQQDDTTGAVGGSGPTATVNANSTGLAGQAFLAGGRADHARLAQAYVRSLQYGCEFPEALRGGVAYDRAAYDLRLAEGADAVPNDQDNRSTAQAALALAGTPLFVVTSAGADAVAPTPDCAPSTTTPPVETSTSTTTPPVETSTATTTTPPVETTTSATGGSSATGSTSTPGGAVLGGDRAAPVRSGALADTGSEPLPVVVTALVLVALGGGLLLARRTPRGRHQ